MSVASSLGTLLTNAAATMSAPILPIVRPGEPDIVGDVPTLAYWYMGRKTWEANTFTFTQELSCWHIRGYFPLKPRITVSSDLSVEAWLEALVLAVEAQLWGHIGLLGAATGQGSPISEPTAGHLQDGAGADYRTVDWDIEVMLSNVHPIAV